MEISASSIAKEWVFGVGYDGLECFDIYQKWCIKMAASLKLDGVTQQLLVGYVAYYLESEEAIKFLSCFEK